MGIDLMVIKEAIGTTRRKSEIEDCQDGETVAKRLVLTVEDQIIKLKHLSNSPFVKEFLLFSSSSIIKHGSGFMVTVIVAKILGPTRFGLWNILSLLIAYSSIVHLGVINAMNRDVPFFKGQGNLQKVDEIRRVSLGFILVSTVSACTVMAIVTMFIKDTAFKSSLRFMILLFSCIQIYNYLEIYLKSDKRFNMISYQQFIFDITYPLIAIPLAVAYGLPGYILGRSIVVFIVALVIIKLVPFDLRPRFCWQETIRLIRVGFPIMSAGLLYGLLTTVDRWVIISFLSVKELGYYSPAIMVMSFLMMIPMIIAQQVYPRMSETFGSTSSYIGLKKWIFRQSIMALIITALLVIPAYFIFPFIVHKFLDAYVPGITAMKIILIGQLFLPLTGGLGNFLNTVSKQVYYMAVQGLAVLANLLFSIIFVKMGLGINGVALGTTVTYLIYSTTLLAVTVVVFRKGS